MDANPGCSRVVLAIDQTEVTDVLELGKDVLSRAGCVKISTHLVQRMAPGRAALFVRNHGGHKIFYDARFVDDRSDNVAADIRVVFGDGRETIRPPELVSVHYAVGKKGLSSAVEAAQDRTEIVAFLSSSNWSEEDYLTMHDAKPEDTVRRYARIAAEAGVRSVMCAAADAWVIKQDSDIRHLTVYGTGTRITGDPGGEHKRIVTPEVALHNGVDYFVIGTPIVKTNDPYAALLRYGKEITKAQHYRVAASQKHS